MAFERVFFEGIFEVRYKESFSLKEGKVRGESELIGESELKYSSREERTAIGRLVNIEDIELSFSSDSFLANLKKGGLCASLQIENERGRCYVDFSEEIPQEKRKAIIGQRVRYKKILMYHPFNASFYRQSILEVLSGPLDGEKFNEEFST